eukprot:TRINITY_DN4539_c0_g2_i1.p1 TRINITY_DN4539_c0_g2~~TRINITY_DN4539_c0_g2_i1.p1  ORF type:complete len:434 (-),score=53.89 TRINITY_DN4539_c0_g2_i1:126-1427(-)
MAPCSMKNVVLTCLFLQLYSADAYRIFRSGHGNASAVPARTGDSKSSSTRNAPSIPSGSRSSSSSKRSGSRPKSASRPPGSWRHFYKVVREVGEGSSGRAYLVEQRDNPRIQKVVREVDNRKHEDEVMRLELPFVADIEEEFVEGKEKVALLTRYYEGGDLWDYLQLVRMQGETIPPGQVKFWGMQMAYGLWHLHRSQVLYGDLKLENTFMTDVKVVLADFGLSTRPCPNERGWACETERKGTPDYVTPSIVEGRPHGYEVDWWALSVAMFMMQEGKRFVSGESDEDDKDVLLKVLKMGRNFRLEQLSDSPQSELIQFLKTIVDSEAFKDLETDKARAQMVDKASVHPILKHPYWHGTTNATEIDQKWSVFCWTYAIHKKYCSEVKGPPAWAKDYPRKRAIASDIVLDDSEIHLTCFGVECTKFPKLTKLLRL